MKRMIPVLIIVALLAIVAVAGGMKKASSSAPSGSEVSGEKAEPVPNFTVYDKDGNEIDLESFLGKPVVINFWATWCPYCVAELSDFDRIAGEYRDSVNFMFIDVTDGRRETVEKALKYIEERGYENITSVYDTRGNASGLFRIRSLPTTIYLNGDGTFYDNRIGQTNYDAVKNRLDGMLS